MVCLSVNGGDRFSKPIELGKKARLMADRYQRYSMFRCPRSEIAWRFYPRENEKLLEILTFGSVLPSHFSCSLEIIISSLYKNNQQFYLFPLIQSRSTVRLEEYFFSWKNPASKQSNLARKSLIKDSSHVTSRGINRRRRIIIRRDKQIIFTDIQAIMKRVYLRRGRGENTKRS